MSSKVDRSARPRCFDTGREPTAAIFVPSRNSGNRTEGNEGNEGRGIAGPPARFTSYDFVSFVGFCSNMPGSRRLPFFCPPSFCPHSFPAPEWAREPLHRSSATECQSYCAVGADNAYSSTDDTDCTDLKNGIRPQRSGSRAVGGHCPSAKASALPSRNLRNR